MDLELSDMIGIVAAYIAKGYYVTEIEERLSPVLGEEIAYKARATFEMFDDRDGRGLWTQGAAMDDIVFTDDKLKRMYPHVGMGMDRAKDASAAFDK